MGDLAWEPEKVDADRVRKAGAAAARPRHRRYHAGVEHVATGRLVAWTTLAGTGRHPDALWQHITIVEPRHRGHRLGMIVKMENLRHAREHRPQLTAIDTWQRRRQRAHDLDQRGDGVPGGRLLDRSGSRPV